MPPSAISVRRRPWVAVLAFGLVASIALGLWTDLGAVSIYGYAVFTILGTKLFLSLLPPTKFAEPSTPVPTGVVITSYNEDPTYLRACLDSIVAQDQRPVRLVVVDDHSTDLAGYSLAQEYAARHDWITAVRHTRNMGKRDALATGFRLMADEVDVFMCVDSDTVLQPQALSAGTRPFSDPMVTAVSGTMVVENYSKNILTRIIDVRFVNAFVGERAAYSKLGSVLCVCGALAFYRRDVIMRHLDAFLTQTFRGQRATVGDDRHLTNLCLTEGKVVLAEGSIGSTAVPEKMGHYVRQQARWGRSFFRESWWVMQNRRPNVVAWWLTLLELAQWAFFTGLITVILAHLAYSFATGGTPLVLVWVYLAIIGLMALARSVRYFDIHRSEQSFFSRMVSLAVSPLYGYMNLVVMLPLRIWSLMTLSNAGWSTRKTVEVAAAPAATGSTESPVKAA